ncbi:GH32 C-terminal domain-containing protein [Lactiplantibacillus plantarum]|uniref:GH32 C-terminal domain-containing protein n=1 Tax=Lactiplantibacillus plantarum TaxID=1590 RepID=UPI0015E025BF|nr:GH32 C-terminal domain-containing protein [Lactiplantibacillus plantarum]QLL40357.1 hypothetical protein FEM49_03331 [Lactiplantibacillus plantarum]
MKNDEKQYYKMYKSKSVWVFACLSTCFSISMFNGKLNVSASTSDLSNQINQTNIGSQTSNYVIDVAGQSSVNSKTPTSLSSTTDVSSSSTDRQTSSAAGQSSVNSKTPTSLSSTTDVSSLSTDRQTSSAAGQSSVNSKTPTSLSSTTDISSSSTDRQTSSAAGQSSVNSKTPTSLSSTTDISSSSTDRQTSSAAGQSSVNSKTPTSLSSTTDISSSSTDRQTSSAAGQSSVNSKASVDSPVSQSGIDKKKNSTNGVDDKQVQSSDGQLQDEKSKSVVTKVSTVTTINSSINSETDISQSGQYNEQYRNQFHYSNNENWINDPNGLFYDSSTGVYNLYYQYNPKGNQWGNMSWGHAVSKDMINWTQGDVAIPWLENQSWEDFTYTNTTGSLKDYGKVRYVGTPTGDWGTTPNSKAIFSGSIVVDTDNVSGLGRGAILAFYTADYQIATRKDDGAEDGWGTWIGLTEIQEQHLAYSLDGGKSFIQYSKDGDLTNPQAIIPTSMNHGGDAANFRDPSVVYDAANKQYYLTVVSGQQALIYKSSNLLDWTYASKIVRENDVGNGVWECPSLIPMKVSGTNDTKWIFCVSVQKGAHATGSGMQYYIGDMSSDGTWVPESSKTLQNPMTMDYGEDFYAGIPFSNMLDGRTVMLAWESNWSYTGEANTTPWYGNMTLPRELNLEKSAGTTDGYLLSNTVVKEIANNEEANVIAQNNSTFSISSTNQKIQYSGKQYKISATFSWNEINKPSSVGFKLRVSDDKKYDMLIGYDLTTGLFFVQRLNTGEPNMGAPRDKMNTTVNADGSITITVYVDETSIEAFANNGERSITQNFFMRPENIGDQSTNGVYVYSDDGMANISNLTLHPITSIWNSVGKLTEKFVDGSGHSISAKVVSSGKIGDSYSTTPKDIAGYTFQKVQGNPTGSFTAQDQSVIYIYTKNPVDSDNVTGDVSSTQSKDLVATDNGTENPTPQKLGNSKQSNDSIKNLISNTSKISESNPNNAFGSTSRLPNTGEDNNERQIMSLSGILLVIISNFLGIIGIKKHRSSL